MSIVDPPVLGATKNTGNAIFALGFRPFFILAAVFAMLAVAAWAAAYPFGIVILPERLSAVHWHGHEMVFGYAMAVVAGFLLTAVGNWTGMVALRGWPLATLAALWLCARLAFSMPGDAAFVAAALADLLFGVALLIAVTRPVWQKRQWKQLGVLSKILLLVVANAVFYAGAGGYLDQGIVWGLHGGLYLLVALVFTMGRRVIPSFIENGVDETIKLRNRGWIDGSSLLLFLLWVGLELFAQAPMWVAAVSGVLLAIHALRLRDWYTRGVWRKPLLWSLYLGYGFVLLGFALKVVAPWQPLAASQALHAFAYGTVGLVTVGMMARVALGHTGRNVFAPPGALAPIFAAVFAGALVRVILPLVAPAHYIAWIGLSQAFWLIAFAGFLLLYVPILWRPRIDGRPG